MSASLAAVFAELPAPLDEPNPVARGHARKRMADHLLAGRMLDKRVAAVTSVLDSAGTLRHRVHRMTEQAAQIPDALLEPIARRVRIASVLEQQRVPAINAGVLRVSVALPRALVSVMAEEAGQRVSDAHHAGIVAQARLPAAGAMTRFLRINAVIDRVTPDPAKRLLQHLHPPARQCANGTRFGSTGPDVCPRIPSATALPERHAKAGRYEQVVRDRTAGWRDAEVAIGRADVPLPPVAQLRKQR
jgi:hypothetical protein